MTKPTGKPRINRARPRVQYMLNLSLDDGARFEQIVAERGTTRAAFLRNAIRSADSRETRDDK